MVKRAGGKKQGTERMTMGLFTFMNGFLGQRANVVPLAVADPGAGAGMNVGDVLRPKRRRVTY